MLIRSKTIGYAALKYPDLPEELPIPLGNQLGVLQRTPLPVQIRLMTQVASQYLDALLEYQYSDAPHLSDPKSAQFYFSDALALLNWLTSNPDVAVRVAKHPKVIHDVVEKLLRPNLEKEMKACKPRPMGGTMEADLGLMLQFVSTVLMRSDHMPVSPPHPRMQELVPLLSGWKRTYRGKYISKVSERLANQIGQLDAFDSTVAAAKELQNDNIVCGYLQCENKKDMNACGQCKLTRYCCVEHQKKDWGSHKKICNKGLLEE